MKEKESEEMAAANLKREKDMSAPRRAAVPEPRLGDAIPDLIKKTKDLLEWMPACSPGSSGWIRRAKVEEALEYLEVAWALARL